MLYSVLIKSHIKSTTDQQIIKHDKATDIAQQTETKSKEQRDKRDMAANKRNMLPTMFSVAKCSQQLFNSMFQLFSLCFNFLQAT